jgi:NAD(P)H dehydrogenase (quinone)
MANVKLAVIYYSATGTNYQMAQIAADAGKAAGAEVRLVKIQETAPESAIASNPAWQANYDATRNVPVASLDDLEWADAFIFSIPTRYGGMPSQVQSFIDTTGGLWFNGKLANKVVSAMTSAQNPHGGQESTLLSFYTSMFHWGAIIAGPGYTDPSIFAAGGNPYGTSVSATGQGVPAESRGAVEHQARRTVLVSSWVKQGLNVR